MTHFIQTLISGLSLGSIYALIALGYTMVYGIAKMLNFAHGDIIMIGAYAGIVTVNQLGLPPIVAVIVSVVICAGLGMLIEFLAYKPLRQAPPLSVLITAIGVSYLLQNLATYITGGLARAYPEISFLKGTFMVGALKVKVITVVTPVLTILLVIALVMFINHTKTGMAMRAVSKDFDTARLMGIKVNSVITVTFVIGSFLAGVGSILYFTNYGQVSPTIGAMPGLKAFVAAVFGGIGSIPGAVLGAYIIGICESLIKANDAIAIFSNAFTFALLILVLLFKPNGMFGEKLTEKV